MIPFSKSQRGTALKDRVGIALWREETGSICAADRSSGDEGGEVEEGEQKKITSVDRHSGKYSINERKGRSARRAHWTGEEGGERKGFI